MADFIIAEKFNAIVKSLFIVAFKRAEAIGLCPKAFGKRKSFPPYYKVEHQNSNLIKKETAESQFERGDSTDRMSFGKNKKKLFLLAAVLTISFIVYLPCLQYGFVNWDDSANVYNNPDISAISNYESFFISVKSIFSKHMYGNYNPLAITSFALEKLVYGLENPGGWHLTNIILHLVCVLLVYRIALAMGLNLIPAAFCALLFGIQPMRVESVAWISERKDVLFGAFYLGALYYYIKSVRLSFRKRYLLIITSCFILSLLSKIQAVTLPLSMLLVDYYFDRKLSMKLIYEKWFYFLLSFITGIAGIYFLRIDGSLGEINNHFSFFERHLPAAFAYLVYWVKSAVPYKMLPIYPYPEEISWVFYVSQLLVFLLFGATYYFFRKKKKWLVFGILFFTINIKPLLQVLSAGQAFMADRFTYIPYVGLFFIYAGGIQWVMKKHKRFNKLVYVTISLVLGTYAYMNIEQSKIWETSETLWSHELKYYHDNLSALYNRGEYYRNEGRYKEALQDFNKYIALHPTDHHVFVERSVAHARLHKYENALLDLKMAEDLAPSYSAIYKNRAVIHARLGEYDKSHWELTKYLSLTPDDQEMWSILATLERLK
jgi:regulator of sirC expression with transglutaminase-like and TPR domain